MHVSLQRVRDNTGRERHPGDAGDLDDALFDGAEAVDSHIDEAQYAFGTASRNVLYAGRELPVSALLADEPLAFRVVQERREEQGIAARRSFERTCELPREMVIGTALRQIRIHRIGTEPLEGDRRRPSMCDQLAREPREGVAARGLLGPIHADDQELRRFAPAAEKSNELGRRRIRPLQVVEHHDNGRIDTQRLEGVGQLAHGACPRRARRAPPQIVETFRGDDSRHLYEPGGGVPDEHVDHAVCVRPATEPTHGVDHREVRLPAPVRFD